MCGNAQINFIQMCIMLNQIANFHLLTYLAILLNSVTTLHQVVILLIGHMHYVAFGIFSY